MKSCPHQRNHVCRGTRQPAAAAAPSAEQTFAAEPRDGVLVVDAAAGSGKTLTIALRVQNLIRSGAMPESILVLTFTRTAATELRRRLRLALGTLTADAVWIHTFHGLGYRLLRGGPRAHGFSAGWVLWDERDRLVGLATAARDVGVKVPKREAAVLALADNPKVADRYTALKRRWNAADYRDLEEILAAPPYVIPFEHWHHVLVDEYQDTTAAQDAFVRTLVKYSHTLRSALLVGDPRQGIFGFAGARSEAMQAWMAEADAVVHMETNWRSAAAIVAIANRVARHMPTAADLPPASPPLNVEHCAGIVELLRPEDQTADVVRLVRAHLDRAPTCSVAVLARTWRELEPVGAALDAADVPWRYSARAQSPLAAPFGRILQHGLQLLVSPSNDWAARQMLEATDGPGMAEYAARDAASAGTSVRDTRIFRTIFGRYATLAADLDVGAVAAVLLLDVGCHRDASGGAESVRAQVDAWAEAATLEGRRPTAAELLADLVSQRVDVADADAEEAPCGVTLGTIHSAKGREWAAVVLLGLTDGNLPARFRDTDPDEERRLFYVGVTRARCALYLLAPQTVPAAGGETRPARPSPFLIEAGLISEE